MNRFASFILLIAFIGQTFNQGVFYLGYMVDKREYVKNCVNKARPQMRCNGKCQLMKKLEEQAKKERQQAPELKLAAKTEIIPSQSFSTYTPLFSELKAPSYSVLLTSGVPVDQPASIFHPPSVTA